MRPVDGGQLVQVAARQRQGIHTYYLVSSIGYTISLKE